MLVQDWYLPTLKCVFVGVFSHLDVGSGHMLGLSSRDQMVPGTPWVRDLPGAYEPGPTIDSGSVPSGLIFFFLGEGCRDRNSYMCIDRRAQRGGGGGLY